MAKRTLKAATPLLLVRKEITKAEAATGQAPLLLGENFFRLDDHVDRFFRSCEKGRLSPPVDKAEVKHLLAECTHQAGLDAAFVQMISTRGPYKNPMVRDPRQCSNTFYAYAMPYIWIVRPDRQDQGIDLAIAVGNRRTPKEAIDPTMKNFNWLDLTKGLLEGLDRGGVAVEGQVAVQETEGRIRTVEITPADAPACPEAVEAMRPFFDVQYANPSGSHRFARAARAAVDDAREAVAAVVGCDAGEVVFTGGGTESDNTAVLGTMAVKSGNPTQILSVALSGDGGAIQTNVWISSITSTMCSPLPLISLKTLSTTSPIESPVNGIWTPIACPRSARVLYSVFADLVLM